MPRIRINVRDPFGAALRQTAGQRRVPFHDFVRLVLERGYFAESCAASSHDTASLVHQRAVLQAVLETRCLLRRLISSRDPGAVELAQAEATAEVDKLMGKK